MRMFTSTILFASMLAAPAAFAANATSSGTNPSGAGAPAMSTQGTAAEPTSGTPAMSGRSVEVPPAGVIVAPAPVSGGNTTTSGAAPGGAKAGVGSQGPAK